MLKPSVCGVLLWDSAITDPVIVDAYCRELEPTFREVLGVSEIWHVNSLTRAAEVATKADDYDTALLHFVSWVPEEWPVRLSDPSRGRRVVLWASGNEPSTTPLSGVLAFTSTGRGLGYPLPTVFGPLEDVDVQKQLVDWFRAAAAVRRLHVARIGRVGANCPGMLDAEPLSTDAPSVVSLGLNEAFEHWEQVDPEVALTRMDAVLGSAACEVARADLESTARWLVTCEELVRDNGLDALGMRCWPEVRDRTGACPCVAFAQLSESGVAGVCENDPNAAVTMMLAQWLTGSPAFYADMGRLIGSDAVQLWHMGSAAPSLAGGRPSISSDPTGKRPHFDFHLRPGRVTLAKLGRAPDGAPRLFLAGATGRSGQGSPGNGLDIVPDVGRERLIAAMLADGIEHHVVACYGDCRGAFANLAQLEGWRVTAV